jgi:deazaflavin-dependent oxidoreductase (nitroreductase family)
MSVLYGEEHVRRYRETDGDEGYRWRKDTTILLLTVTGRKSGERHTKPLIFALDGDTPVIVASRGGAPDHPDWYKNLVANPDVEITVDDRTTPMRARTATPEEKAELWPQVVRIYKGYAAYQRNTDRDIPLVICEPR